VTHPLLAVLLAAANDEFPPADGRAVYLPPLPRGLVAVVSLTGRVYLATDHRLPDLDGYGSALAPEVLRHLAGPHGTVDGLDTTLVRRGVGDSTPGALPVRTDLADHPRVRHARRLREGVRVYGDDRGLVTLAAGLAGRTEMSVEAFRPGEGHGLIRAALALVPAGAPVFAAVAPGNARSLRAFLAEGFVPIGSEVIIQP
jgi:hypothetical protein